MENVIVTTPDQLKGIVKTALSDYFERNPIQQQSSDDDDLLTIQQASELVNLAPSTLYSKTSTGTIPFTKRGKKLYFRKSDLIRWIETGNIQPARTTINKGGKWQR